MTMSKEELRKYMTTAKADLEVVFRHLNKEDPPPAPVPPPPEESLSAKIARLGQSSDPRDRLEARLLILKNPRAYASPLPPVPPPAPPAANPPPAAPAAPPPLDVVAEVDRLSSSANPHDRFRARVLVMQQGPRAYAAAAAAKRGAR